MTTDLQGLTRERVGVSRKFGLIAAPLAAIAYPWTLRAFNVAAVESLEPSRPAHLALWLGAALFLALAFAIPLVGLLASLRLARIAGPTAAERRAELVALIVVAAPAIYTFLGVVDYMTNSPLPDEWAFALLWAVLIIAVAVSPDRPCPIASAAVAPAALRVAHGVAAIAILAVFLGFHLVNHLAGLIGPDAHRSLMKSVHAIYGSAVVEPLLVAVLLFQVASGSFLASRHLRASADPFRFFQIASGVYLAVFILGHMNSVFVYARSWSNPPIVTDWSFATSEAWGGLIRSGWSNRLIPHYAFGVFFVVAHMGAGLRMAMIGHGLPERWANRAMIGVATAAFLLALAIMLGMCGVRLDIG
ncbi:hypothetical protein [Methylosinus sp. Sm6]|uniref:hypothetical protein n=1 Tax=Methylosinus sp. Sm6 TaxID=2866948 RepID=UPI001C9A148F|nr:hypothetical protein [Methylosinus sp. Sm6]MBY6241250.1 hypothetical protein [Methylosinus sp. Sm6]